MSCPTDDRETWPAEQSSVGIRLYTHAADYALGRGIPL